MPSRKTSQSRLDAKRVLVRRCSTMEAARALENELVRTKKAQTRKLGRNAKGQLEANSE